MNQPCPSRIDCPGTDNPLRNFSAEAPDPNLTCVTSFFEDTPRLGTCFEKLGCAVNVCSTVSRSDAQTQADIAARLCVWETISTPGCDPEGGEFGSLPPTIPPPVSPVPRVPVLVYYNTAQTCSAPCGDGTTFEFTVPAGQYVSLSQAAANAEAMSIACKEAQELVNEGECMACCDQVAEILEIIQGSGTGIPVFAGSNPAPGVELTRYGETIVASGLRPMAYTLESGSLPTGTTLNGSTGLISGNSPTAGTYTFTIRATNVLGSSTQQFSIYIAGLVPVVIYPVAGAYSLDPVSPSDVIVLYQGTNIAQQDSFLTSGVGWNGTVATFSPTGVYLGGSPGTSPITYSILGTMPPGITIDASTGSLVGIPTTYTGFYHTVAIVASNAYGSWNARYVFIVTP